MADLLLDTHVMLWLVSAPARLGGRCRQAIMEASAVYISSVTHAELQIKAGIGKIALPADLPRLLAEQGLQPLAFTDSHAAAMSELPELARHDPFDRMLLAQAMSARLDFCTADSRLLDLGLSVVTDARL